MDTPALVSLPVPMATAFLCFVLAGLIWRLNLGPRRANTLFASFFGLGAITSFMVGLRFGYGLETLLPLQRTLPLLLAPLLYLGFASLTVERRRILRLALLHLGAPLAGVAVVSLIVDNLGILDLAITASYAAYSVLLFLLWRQGPDALTFAPVNVTQSMSSWLLRGIGFLVFILLLDSAVAIDFALTQGANASRLISIGTVPLVILLLATLITLPMVFSPAHPASGPKSNPVAEDIELMGRLDGLMEEHRLYLVPDITVQRLARRLSVPARNVSAAVNQTKGMNISQYVNRHRLVHAANLLVDTKEPVTSIATQSGFLTRSNFYREFQKMYGQTPIEYRASNQRRDGPDNVRPSDSVVS